MHLDKDHQDDGFPFTLTHEGKDYDYAMRLPTTEEAMKASELDETKALDFMLGFVDPKSEGAPPIKEVVKKKNIKWLRRFVAMVKAEWEGE